ncbi:DNA polymerase IV [Chryseotalea sanaruensis]|uniref:DNA polymerase IV n=1 Tax=Chryseotalea sanaruensis TaxID=2482724 RepID=A0A401U734_9BACT|nr:DNA polymerase IV [Chryseotalea sanaruensis]GCC50680.1 DNA polymerase IV [Chryseotalea sanaruensis]
MEEAIVKPFRKIIHVDMDAFYASIEQRDFPEYRGKPIVVGGSPEGRGGVVATASYEARKFGVRSAMPSKKAKQLCPQVIFVYPRFAVYKEVSYKIREIFQRYTDLIEPLSLDEAYLDVTEDKLGIGSAIEIATQIKDAINSELQLTASAGISINKFVAKIASDMNKPNGLTFIGPSRVENFIEKLPVEKFFGVGKVTAEKMKGMNLHTGADLKKLKETELIKHFGKAGRFYYKIVRGEDNRPVKPDREAKSVGAEDTFPYDLTDVEEMVIQLKKLSVLVVNRLQKQELKGRTITLKVKYHDFKQITRSRSFLNGIDDEETILETVLSLLQQTETENVKVRLLGISLSNFNDVKINSIQELPNDQLTLF